MLFGDAVLGSNVLGSTEALTVTPTPTPTNPLLGGGGSRRKWKDIFRKVTDADIAFPSEPPEPVAFEIERAETIAPRESIQRPTVAAFPALPDAPTFDPPLPWTPATDDDAVVRQRHLARVAAVEAARERNRLAAEQHAAQVAHAEAQLQAFIARQRHDQSIMSLLLQVDDL